MIISKRGLAIAVLGASLIASVTASADVIESNCDVPVNSIGQVMTLNGSASAIGTNGCSRALACGSSLYGGESIATGAGSSAGILVGDVLTQLGPDSTATFGTTPNGAPDVALTRGTVRVSDPRETGAPVQLSARDYSTEFTGNDAGATIVDGGAQLCAASPIPVTHGGSTTTTEPGACATTVGGFAGGGGGGGAGSGGGAAGGSISGDTCMQVASNEHLVPLPPVSDPPGGPPLPDPPESPPRTPCEVGACGRSFEPPIVTEQPPTESPFPGGGGTFGGGQSG